MATTTKSANSASISGGYNKDSLKTQLTKLKSISTNLTSDITKMGELLEKFNVKSTKSEINTSIWSGTNAVRWKTNAIKHYNAEINLVNDVSGLVWYLDFLTKKTTK